MTSRIATLVAGNARALFDVGAPDATSAPADPLIRQLDPAADAVSAFDLAVIRGDGVFEATTVVNRVPLALKLHIRRLADSAVAVELPPIVPDAWLRAVAEAVELHAKAHDRQQPRDALLKILVSRGADPSTSIGQRAEPGLPSVWIFLDDLDPASPKPEEITAVTLSKEISSDSAARAPWLLLGAKTLSYAMNMATFREARRRGVDNAIFVTRDGYVLEGPTASVVIRAGGEFVTPDPALGILHGTTQQEFFAYAKHLGLPARYARLTVDELMRAEQIWMMGGSTCQMVGELDGKTFATDPGFTRDVNAFMRTERALAEKYSL